MTTSFVISDILPAKFDGSNQSVSFWSRSLKVGRGILGYDSATSLKIFRIWNTGDATNWVTTKLRDSDTETWPIDDWLTAIKKNYVLSDHMLKLSIGNTIRGLEECVLHATKHRICLTIDSASI
jgi:hypothetical protein